MLVTVLVAIIALLLVIVIALLLGFAGRQLAMNHWIIEEGAPRMISQEWATQQICERLDAIQRTLDRAPGGKFHTGY